MHMFLNDLQHMIGFSTPVTISQVKISWFIPEFRILNLTFHRTFHIKSALKS